MTDTPPAHPKAKKHKKPPRIKPHLPRGLRDVTAADWHNEHIICTTLAALYETYGFAPLETPTLEYAEILGSFLPDAERPNAGVFALEDDDGKWLSLRYDLTAPLARYVAAHYDQLPKPYRRYQYGSVYRNEKPGPGRYRQFVQIDADIVGVDHAANDAEMCLMAHDAMLKLGFSSSEFRLRYSTRKLMDVLMDTLEIESPQQRTTILRAIDKRDRLGIDGVRDLLGDGRRDTSGDFTAGAALDTAAMDKIITLLESTQMSELSALLGERAQIALSELQIMADYFAAHDVAPSLIGFDTSIVRGLGYYTGPVFEIELTQDDNTMLTRLGAVGGGGRYDDLITRFKGVQIPATGISIGVSRLAAARAAMGRVIYESPPLVMVAMMDNTQITAHALLVRQLRKAGFHTELYMGNSGLKAQLRYADTRGVRLVLIEGDDERANGTITIKDMVLGAQKSSEIDDNATWRASTHAQRNVKKQDIIAEINQILMK